MISHAYLKRYVKNYPRLKREAYKDKDYPMLQVLDIEEWTIRWILEDDDDA